MEKIPIDELVNAERQVDDHIELNQSIADLTPLANKDIVPTLAKDRTWKTLHIASLWIGMAVCIPTYQLAGGMMSSGMNWWQAIFTVFLGNLIVLIPMILNAVPGTKYGIPFPVLVRASFGTRGANIPALLRALVACGWFGIQTWIGGSALYELVKIIASGMDSLPVIPFFNINIGQFACFIVFWLVNMYFIWTGTESIKWMETLAAPFLIIMGLLLLFWAYKKIGDWGPIFAQPSIHTGFVDFLFSFGPWLTAMVGFWATLSLNIPDFSRYAKSQKNQIAGQTIGLPGTMLLYSFIGVAVTSAAMVIWTGEAALKNPWDPVEVMARVGHDFMAQGSSDVGMTVIILGMLGLLIATLSTNIAANVVSPANDFSNLNPRRISFKLGGTITGIIGILIMPWKLIETSAGYIYTWLIGYGTLLGPIAGIMLVDYFIIRRRKLNLLDLYREKGIYSYYRGFNPVALISLVIGVLPNIPGFWRAATLAPHEIELTNCFWDNLYCYGWFIGLFIAGMVYGV